MNLTKWYIKRKYAINKRITKSQITEIRRLREEGLSYRNISRIVGVSPYTAYFYCLSEEEKVVFRSKVYHRKSREEERMQQIRFRQRKQDLFKIGGLYKEGEEDD